MKTKPARARMPAFARRMRREAGHLAPRFTCIFAAEKRGGSGTGVEHVRLRRQTRLDMPDAFKFQSRLSRKTGTLFCRSPRIAEIIRIDDFGAEPRIICRRENSATARIANGVIDLFPFEKRTAHFPVLAIFASEKK